MTSEHRLARLDPFDLERFKVAEWPPAEPHIAHCTCGYRFHGEDYDHARLLWVQHRDVATRLMETA